MHEIVDPLKEVAQRGRRFGGGEIPLLRSAHPAGTFGSPARTARRLALPVLLLAGLAACGGNQTHVASGARYGYDAPGPEGDPWGPYISEASTRFAVPDRWIREVMRQESGGHQYMNGQPTTSDAGAAGLMQVMPQTYAELSARYGLGSDPYNPHDNIIAGTAYIREMYDRFGSPAFLAAYNAGPQRVQDYLDGRSSLPNQTVNYLAAIAPRLGNDRPMTGPLVAYADNGGAPLTPDPVPQAYATRPIAGCWRDPDAAYDPDAPCRAGPPARVATAPAPTPVRQVATQERADCWRDPNAAYDPDAPCRPRPVEAAAASPPPVSSASCWHDPNAAYDPDAPCRTPPVQIAAATPAQATSPGQYLWANPAASSPAQAAPAPRTPPAPPPPPPAHRSFGSYLIPSAAAAELPRPVAHVSGAWSVQVGAFADSGMARQIANSARSRAPHELAGTQTVLGATSPFGGHVLYRARLAGLSAQAATMACSVLTGQGQACVTVPPGG